MNDGRSEVRVGVRMTVVAEERFAERYKTGQKISNNYYLLVERQVASSAWIADPR